MTAPRFQLDTKPFYALPIVPGTITTLPAGSTATAAIRNVNGTQYLDLGLPEGEEGPSAADACIRFDEAQSLTQPQKVQALLNAGAVQNGTGVGQSPANIVAIGLAGALLKATVDTTDFGQIWTDQAAGKSLATNGYQILPSGLILQWGTSIVLTDSNGYATVTFNTAFPNAAGRIVCLNGSYVSGPQVLSMRPAADGFPTKTAFGLRVWSVITQAWGANYYIAVDWIAVGY